MSSSPHMHSIIEPAFRCTIGSKWSEDVTFSQQFAVFSTWDVAHRGLWTTSQWPPMPLSTANRSTKPARHPSDFSHHNFEILLTSGNVKASVTSRKVTNGRSTGTCENRHDDLWPNRFNEQRKNRSQNACFSTKTTTFRWDGPFGSKGPNPAWILPIDRRRGPEGRLPRLSKAVKVTAASNDHHPLKILAKRGRAYPTDGVLCRVVLTKKHLKQTQNRRIWTYFIGGIGPRSHPQLWNHTQTAARTSLCWNRPYTPKFTLD